jgi:hypothetical protein
MSNRYIYHYNAITKGGAASMSGIAQLKFRIKSQEDLEVLKGLINRDGFIVSAITSLSYLGRENDDEEYDATKFDQAFLINKFYERYPLSEFKSDSERAEALGYFMAGAELQRLGKFIEYNDEDDGDDY